MVSNLDYTPKLALKKGFEHVPKTLKVESRGIEPRSDSRAYSLLRV